MFANEDKEKRNLRLYRYTKHQYALEMIRTKEIVIPEPRGWDDVNDLEGLLQYQRIVGLVGLGVLCMTSEPDTYHHWKLYAHGQEGIALVFDRKKMREWARTHRGTRLQSIRYVRMQDLKDLDVSLTRLPYLKRWGYRSEREWRLLYEADVSSQLFKLPFPSEALSRIVINPWANIDEYAEMKDEYESILDRRVVRVTRTELVNSQTWRVLIADKADECWL